MQDRSSLSINRTDTSINHSSQLESALPPSKISALNSGEFVGMVADDPDNKIQLKAFHSTIINNHKALKNEQQHYKDLPLIRHINSSIIQKNYLQIKQEVEDLVNSEMHRIMNDPATEGMVLKKG